ncbi:MAG: alkaline phosphatase family protein [Pseudomonadota bacterium]
MRRVVMMIIDGLRRDCARAEWMPSLAALAESSRQFAGHRGVFPSATRVSSSSIATGCWPARHGLAGNSVAWRDGGGFQRVSAGTATFVEDWIARDGRALKVPTMADRLGEEMLIVSNSSPGAARLQDPNRAARFMHRSGAWLPGGAEQPALDITYTGTGDAVATSRFCEQLLHGRAVQCALLWICEPDHSQHRLPLGSPDHRALLAGSDRMVAQVVDVVARLREAGDDVLLLVGSDHGHETIDAIVDVDMALVEAGFKATAEADDLVVAPSGMGGLIYAVDEDPARAAEIARWFREQPWCHDAWSGNRLGEVHQVPANGMIVAFAMARRDTLNPYGVPGYAHTIKDRSSPNDAPGNGQHGGWGPYEGAPALFANGREFVVGTETQVSALVDIAPTIYTHLGVAVDGPMDGEALQLRRSGGAQ